MTVIYSVTAIYRAATYTGLTVIINNNNDNNIFVFKKMIPTGGVV